MIGTTIGKYRFVEELERGGSGTVYRATDETLHRDVLIRVVHIGDDHALLRHFQSGAATLAKLHHPDIVSIHEFQRADSKLLMVMELVQGETLDQLSERCGPLPVERAAYLVSQVLGALEHAHGAGIVHRDLKPSNVIVTDDGRVKVMDFGMVHVAGEDQMTSDGFALTTPAFMAPERLLGKELDGRADLYSAGVLFFKLLTGHVPHEAASPLEMVQKQLAEPPKPVQAFRADLPGWCQAILDRALARTPNDRFSTAEAFRAALAGAIDEATQATGLYPVQEAAPAAAAAPAMPANHDDEVTAMIATPSRPAEEPATVPAMPRVHETTAVAPTPRPTPIPSRLPLTPGGPTLVMKKNQFAAFGGLLFVLVLAVLVLIYVALRQPAPVVSNEPAPQAVSSAASTPEPAAPATPPPAPPAPVESRPAAAPAPVEVAPPPLVLPPTTEPPGATAAPAPPPVTTRTIDPTPFRFEAKAVVVDGDRRRERDATVVLADGAVTVREKDKTDQALYIVPLEAVIGLTYSNSRQPLWNSPNGPAEAMRVEGGAFGFLKGGERNWFGLRTRDSLLVVRVEDDAVLRVSAGLQERTGLHLERLAAPNKD